MKDTFVLEYRDTEENRLKSSLLSPIEVMFDDRANVLPPTWYTYWCTDLPFGSKIRITLELVE